MGALTTNLFLLLIMRSVPPVVAKAGLDCRFWCCKFMPMEALLIFLLFVTVVVLVLIRRPLKRALQRKAQAKGRELGMNYGDQFAEKLTQKTVQSATDKLGTSLVVPLAVEQKLREVLNSTKKVASVDGNHWHLAFAKPDDILLRWVPGVDHGILRVAQTIEMFGSPCGERQWLKVVASVEGALQDAGFQVERQQTELRRQDAPADVDSTWVAA